MRFSYLKQIVLHMQKFSHIVAAYRISDTTLNLVFERDNSWNF